MKFKGIITLTLIFALASASIAQTGKLKRAKQYMKDLSYMPAIVLLNQILEKEGNPDAKIAIAECYRKVNDWENAEYWYAQVVRNAQVDPLQKLYYGESLQRNGKCDLAKDWYAQFTQASPNDIRGQYLSKACDYENELLTKNAAIYNVKRMDFNSPLDDYSPAIFKDQVVFTSDRAKGTAIKRDHTWTGNPFNELFVVDAKKNGPPTDYKFTYGKPGKFSAKLNTKYHDAAVSFSPDYSEIFFTRNNYLSGKTGRDDEGFILLKVYTAKASGVGAWTEVAELPFNSDEYNVAHPAISPDGNKIYFSSNMPGGFGGMDLYVSEKDGGKWGPPVNLGPRINTEGLEVFPYVDKSGKLFFSSDGHIGLGGLDIYYMDPKENSEWGEVINAGFPLNSKHDDFGVSTVEDGKFGYFSSDRPGGSGRDDIYSFHKMSVPATIFVFDAFTKLPVENAEVIDSCTGVTYRTGKDGVVKLDMRLDACCSFQAAADGYVDNSAEACSKDQVESVKVEIPLSMVHRYALSGVVFDHVKNLPLEGALVTVSNTCGKKDTVLITNADGRFEMPLDRECCYKAKASFKDYISSSKDSICTAGINVDSTFRPEIYIQPIMFQPDVPVVADKSQSKGKNDIAANSKGDDNTGKSESGGKRKKDKNKDKTKDKGKDLADANAKDQITDETIFTGDKAPYGDKVGPYVWNPKTGLYEGKGGKPAAGSYKDYVFENGNVVKSSVFVPGPVQTPNMPTKYLLHIYYDFDQSFLREEAVPELEKLFTLLKDNPTYVIELGSHTDSRGSNAYNKRLSQRRADVVVKWLVKNGIEKDRLVPIGYGELANVNNCKDFIPCSEQEHQMNRRTEFRILGCKGCTDNPIISNPNENTKVDKCIGCPF
ncbi:MAG: OmpA family protein [Saprospiraceae bacterium]